MLVKLDIALLRALLGAQETTETQNLSHGGATAKKQCHLDLLSHFMLISM